MHVVESGEQPDLFGKEHAVAKNVTRHVADAEHRYRILEHIHPKLPEVTAHTLPGTSGSDAFSLVIVSLGTARGECVSQPEVVLGGSLVCEVAERSRPLVGGNDKIGIGIVIAKDAIGLNRATVHDVVGHIEQAPNKGLVLHANVFPQRHAIARGVLENEPPLRTDRDDHGILGHLSLHKPQDLGAEIVGTIAPPHPTACDPPTT